MKLTVQTHLDDAWRDAATVTFDAPERGILGATRFAYDDDYFFEHAVIDAVNADVNDRRAVSVKTPVTLETRRLPTWPAWLLDLIPQGVARVRLAEEIGLRSDDPALEIQLLLRAGGSPIGNLRLKEAWEAEQQRLTGIRCPPLVDHDIATKSERFLDVVERFAYLASGSSGVQGEWPKALMTRHRDGFWYPDPFVRTEDGIEHAIVKLLRSNNADDALIIASEEPYLRIAEAFGLTVAAPLRYGNGTLFIPRFDRTTVPGQVFLHGQESLVSAMGIAEFGRRGHHEDYLAMVQACSDDPAADTLEYVLRDVLNAAMGNPDNHGRNTALSKSASGGIRLSPLYDFAPMRLSAAGIVRATRWRCLGGNDLDGDWSAVCGAAACEGLTAEDLRDALLNRMDFIRNLPKLAAETGVSQDVIARAFNAEAVAAALERLEGSCRACDP